jgi:lipopolysaccharide biosynthesis regulator YciM
MYYKLLFSILFTITSCFSLVAQSKDLLYQAEIQAAQNDLKDEQFRSAIRHLEKAKSINPQTTPTIQSLYVKSYLGLTYYDDARTALKTYFEIAKEGDDGFDEMLLLLSKIDDIENEVAKKEELTKKMIGQFKKRSARPVHQYLMKYVFIDIRDL